MLTQSALFKVKLMRQIFGRRVLRTSLLKNSWARLQVNTSGDMARYNYGMSMSDEKCGDIAETFFVEENHLTSKPPVQRSGAPAYNTNTVSLTDPYNEKSSPPPYSPVPSAIGLPDKWRHSATPCNPQVKLLILKLRKI